MNTPELELSDDETKKFANSLARISSLYDDRINPKVVAWVDLLAVVGAIYGPRAIAINARMNEEKSLRRPVVTVPLQATPINTPRQNSTPQNPPRQNNARSPVELFGDVNFGASIPDAV